MGYALMWVESLAAALLVLALAVRWAALGRRARLLWVAGVFLAIFIPAVGLVFAARFWNDGQRHLVRTTWFPQTLSWLIAFTAAAVILLRRGLRRPGPGLARPAADWPRRSLWLGLGGALLALGFTFWNIDLAVRADLAIARQEAGAVLLAMTPPPVAESENAARVYEEAMKDFNEKEIASWRTHVHRGQDAHDPSFDRIPVDWRDPASRLAELVMRNEHRLALLRQGAAMPRCHFGRQPTLLDAVAETLKYTRKMPHAGITLLGIDARLKALHGNLTRAFEDIAAILGIMRHIAAESSLLADEEATAWRTLEDVLRLAPRGHEPLPPLAIPGPPPLIRKVREELMFFAMLFPTFASQPSIVLDKVREKNDPPTALLIEAVFPLVRVFIIPDDVSTLRMAIADYQNAPRSGADETPAHWAELHRSVREDPMSVFGVYFMKPKNGLYAYIGAAEAALRRTATTGLAIEAYRRKHRRCPERLEQLVPEFLPAVPVDPRDGRPLQLRRAGDTLMIFAQEDIAAVGTRPYAVNPIFRLHAPVGK